MATHRVVEVKQGGDLVGWAVLTDFPDEKKPQVSHLFRTEVEAKAERNRLTALEARTA